MHFKAQAIGRLGRDPEVKVFDNGGQVVNFSIATTEYKGREKGNVTTWVDVSVWNKVRGDFIMNYVRKGALVFVEGIPGTRAWAAKDGSGDIRSTVTITVGQYDGDVKSLARADNDSDRVEASGERVDAQTGGPAGAIDIDDELPDW